MKRWVTLAAVFLLLGPPSGASNTPKNDVLWELGGLRTMQADGSNKQRLTSGDLDGEGSWSPDGRRVVFARYRADTRNWDLYSIRASSESLKRLTRTGASERNPTWSPDGRRIAFERGVKGIFSMRPDGTDVQRISPRGITDALPTWSPNGSRLAFLRKERKDDFDLFVARRDGSRARRIRDLGGAVITMDWGASHWLAMHYYPSGRTAGVYLIRPSGGGIHRVGPRGDSEPVWSPSGEKLLVFNQRDASFGIWVMNKDGSNRMHITEQGSPLDWIAR